MMATLLGCSLVLGEYLMVASPCKSFEIAFSAAFTEWLASFAGKFWIGRSCSRL
jgi:hypothetical protein